MDFILILFLFQCLTLLDKTCALRNFKLQLPSPVIGPEGLAFDSIGVGPYTGVSDGRILKWLGPDTGFVDFAITSKNRSKELCDGSSDAALEPTCGRTLGLGFYHATGDLYIADSYFGLQVVGHNGGIATQLLTAADGVPFRFLNGLDVDQTTGIVYFTDASSRFQRRNAMEVVLTGDKTGRLLQYDPCTREVKVLIKGLAFPAGTALSRDGNFVLVTEVTTSKILRYWIRGPKATKSEVFALTPGQPDNIKRNAKGEFWVAVNIGKVETLLVKQQHMDVVSSLPGDGTKEMIAPMIDGRRPGAAPMAISTAVRISEEGRILEVLHINDGSVLFQSVSEVHEFEGSLYLGSLAVAYVGVHGS